MNPRLIKNNFPNVYCSTCRKSLVMGVLFYHFPEGERGQKMFCSMDCFEKRLKRTEQTVTVIENPKTYETTPQVEVSPTSQEKPSLSVADVTTMIESNNQKIVALIEASLKSNVQPIVKPEVTKTGDITDRITLEGKHKLTERIKYYLKMRKYPFLYGSPGAGKSYLAQQIADDMQLDFVAISCANDMFKSELLGSVSPVSGNYISTSFFNAWKNGGLVILDEVGLASGAFLNVLNNAMANKTLRFPNGELIKMHTNFFLMLADNSALYGNDPLFPERQDAGTAFRDRIKYVKFEYDTDLELMILVSLFGGNKERASKWHRTVLNMRTNFVSNHSDISIFVSPRFAFDAAVDFMHNREWNEIIESGLMKGINGDISKLVMPTINRYMGAY